MQVMEKAVARRSVRQQVKHWLSSVVRRMPWTMQYAVRTAVNPPRHRSRFRNIFHCTTWKAGSQWVRGIFSDRRVYDYSGLYPFSYTEFMPGGVDLRGYNEKSFDHPFPRKTIATPMYMGYEPYRQVPKAMQARAVFIIRDPRDLVVSEFFSVRYSHSPVGRVPKLRAQLEQMSERDGLVFILGFLQETGTFECQRSWVEGARGDKSVLVVHFEDMVAEENLPVWEQVLNHCDIQLPKVVLGDLLHEYSFEVQTGRKRGIEDKMAHNRKGIHGDWKNYFDNQLVAEFKKTTGNLLELLGYESNSEW